MKNITLLLLNFFAISTAFAQQPNSDFDKIVEAEMKAGYNLTSFVANLNTGNYDVTHHTLEFTVDPAVQFVNGTVTTTFTAKESMDSVTFDLNDDLNVTSVTQNGNSLTFTQNDSDELVITLPTVLAQGTEATVAITYSGEPAWWQDAFVTSEHNGTPILWTLSEPYGAKEWWPCKQDLNDKVNDGIDVYITAPSEYTSVSNGLEQSQQDNEDGTTTTHFLHTYPIPAYLVAIAVTNYTIYTQQAGSGENTFPIVNYIYPETATFNQPFIDQTVAIMDFYEDTFEAYPFNNEKYGHAECGFGGGMEHTTVSFMGGFGRELIAHELAHQWFGDKITCGSWKDIWLNEGFATYVSGLVVEHQDGADEFRNWKYNKILSITWQPDGAVYLTDQDTLDVNRIFSTRLTYNKGSMVLHMLRFKLGDATFYQALKNYLADEALAYGYAKTPDFQAHLEEASGTNLDEFFNDWVYNEGHPSYQVDVVNGSSGQLLVTINQTQSDSSVDFFEMPVPIRFTGPNNQIYDVVLNNTENNQQFTVPIAFDVQAVEVNYDFDIISANNTTSLKNEAFSVLQGVKLYPNPTSNLLSIQLPQGVAVEKAMFYNTLGQKEFESTTQTSWNVAKLSAGIHFITLVTNQGSKQLKFIKQ